MRKSVALDCVTLFDNVTVWSFRELMDVDCKMLYLCCYQVVVDNTGARPELEKQQETRERVISTAHLRKVPDNIFFLNCFGHFP